MTRQSALLIVLSGSLAASCAQQPSSIGAFGPAEVARGKSFYDTNGCAACHGHEGHGDGQLAATLTPVPRDFRRADAFTGARTIDAVAAAIARGIPAAPTPMPAFPHLDLETRRLMAAYVLSLGRPSPATPSQVSAARMGGQAPMLHVENA